VSGLSFVQKAEALRLAKQMQKAGNHGIANVLRRVAAAKRERKAPRR
jgi:hypothetical protein